MGWLFMQRLDGHKGPKDYLDAQFTYTNDQSQLRILRSTLVNQRLLCRRRKDLNRRRYALGFRHRLFGEVDAPRS